MPIDDDYALLMHLFMEADRETRRTAALGLLEELTASSADRYLTAQAEVIAANLEAIANEDGTLPGDLELLDLDDAAYAAWMSEQAQAFGIELPDFHSELGSLSAQAAIAGGQAVISEVDPSGEYEISFRLPNDRALDFILDRPLDRIKGIDATSLKVIKKHLVNAVEDGESYTEVAKKIREDVPGTSQYRSKLIAVTEMGDAYAEGTMVGANQLQAKGLTMQKRWLTSKDPKVTAGCRMNAAVGWKPLDYVFLSGGILRPLRFPGCRCDLEIRRDPGVPKPPPPPSPVAKVPSPKAKAPAKPKAPAKAAKPKKSKTNAAGLPVWDGESAADARAVLLGALKKPEVVEGWQKELADAREKLRAATLTKDHYKILPARQAYDKARNHITAMVQMALGPTSRLKVRKYVRFGTDDGSNVKARNHKDTQPWNNTYIPDGISDFNRMFRRGVIPDGLPDYKLPGVHYTNGYGRAYYMPTIWDNSIHMYSIDTEAIVVHELTHWFENLKESEWARKAALDFRKYRSIGFDKAVPMKYLGSPHYDEKEIAYADTFYTDYVGKSYGDDPSSASEILTMGVQLMYEDPVLFALEDPEYFDFIYGILRGETEDWSAK